MSLRFSVLDLTPQAYAVSPMLSARLAVEESSDDVVHSAVLRAQVRIEPQRRPYSDGEADGMRDLFGPRARWSQTLRPFLWLQTTTLVPGFTGSTVVDLPVPCSYDFEVAASKYLAALDDGTVALNFLFSGTVFVRGDDGFSVRQIGWDTEAPYAMPVSVWRDVMDQHFPGAGWIRLGGDAFRALHAYRVEHGLLDADDTVDALLASASASASGSAVRVTTSERLEGARTVADAVLYEGYLLYPYRASSSKNAVRWQFGVLGPPDTASQLGEPCSMHADVLLRTDAEGRITVHLRFLQLQRRQVARLGADGFEDVDELRSGPQRWLSWDEAVPHELTFGPFDARVDHVIPVVVVGSSETEDLTGADGRACGRLERRRHPLTAELVLTGTELDAGLVRVGLTVTNTGRKQPESPTAAAISFLGAHVLLEADGGTFVSLLEPPPDAVDAAALCHHDRCWPVLASPEDDLMLVSPIILYDHPEVAPESAGELYDATEIDEILSLRVMTMTDEEKAEARATDPRAAAIIDRCDAMSPDTLTQMHGRLRNPHAGPAESVDPFVPGFGSPSTAGAGLTFSDDDIPTFGVQDNDQRPGFADTEGKPWWDPGVDGAVDPESDRAFIDGVAVARGARVRVEPRRRADAQDIFFAGREATVAAVYADVDGGTHVAVVLTDDPMADVREWYGRYLYFAPDELVPLGADERSRKEG